MALHPTLEKVLIASDVAYKELIKTQLSFLIEFENGFHFDSIYRITDTHSDTIFGANLTQEGICSINQLMVHIQQKENIVQEGIFRKSGSLIRQNELQTSLCSGVTIDIDTKFNVHDSCCVLKKFIAELPQPLLTNALRSYFLQSLNLNEAKQLNAIRLLILLLPSQNRQFLYDLLMLFDNVLQHSEQNRMTSKNLATIFSQHIFLSKDMKVEKVCDILNSITRCLTFMIDNAVEIFEPSPELIRDANIYLQKREKSIKEQLMAKNEMKNSLISTTNLQAIPCVKFCATAAASYKPKDYTEQHLAELYAHIHSMSASPSVKNAKGKKWIKRFNKENGPGTPMLMRHKEQQDLIKESLKKSAMQKKGTQNNLKSFGSAIKKRFMTPNADKMLKKSKSPKRRSLSGSIERKSYSKIPILEGNMQCLNENATPKNIGRSPRNSLSNKRNSITKTRNNTPVKLNSVDTQTDSCETSAKTDYKPSSRHNTPNRPQSQSASAIPVSKLRQSSLYPLTEDMCKQINAQFAKKLSSLSTNSLPANGIELTIRNRDCTPCPPNSLTELNDVIKQRKVKNLANKFESMANNTKNYKVNVKNRKDTNIDEWIDEQNYVCLSSICTKKSLGLKKSPPENLSDTKQVYDKTGSKLSQSITDRSDCMNKILIADPNMRISLRKSRNRRPLIIEKHTVL